MSEQLILTIIKLHIVDLSDFLNLTRPMKDSQIDQTAEMIIDEFPLMKVADVIYLFKQAKNGAFGNIFEGLDGLKILGWFRQVWAERLDVAENMSEREHLNTKRGLVDIVGDARMNENITSEVKTLVNRSKEWMKQQPKSK